ncbi:MAG: DUF5765 domain-containing protein [Methylocystis sp.]|uniref:DUF5765 domain-containing protein n=1 Tax=Methylocystis sp. TaxID=1911079 RepID=UPI003D0C06C6
MATTDGIAFFSVATPDGASMCWSLAASVTVGAIGVTTTLFAARMGAPRAIWVAVGYFSIMEGLQAAGYFVADACGSPANRLIIALSYLHIVFQPFVINAFAMQLVPAPVSRRVRVIVYCLCTVSAMFMLAQVYPFEWAGTCRIGQVFCGRELCLRSGEWHIAWDIPYNGLARPFDDAIGANWGFPTYVLTVLVLPFLYGSWRFALFHLLAGPVLANFLTSNVNESPAIWCLFSIGIILIAMFPILLRQLQVEHWILWPKSWRADLAPR